MKALLALAVLLPLTTAAQPGAAASGVTERHAPVLGVRAGLATGKLYPTTDRARYTAQVGWAGAVVVGSSPLRRGGLELEVGATALRFRDAAGTLGGARYRWLTAQPLLLGFVRPVPRVQLLGGVGFNVCVSCWRAPFQPYPGGYGFPGDEASTKTSAPSRLFWTAGARVPVTPRWFVDGRYGRTFAATGGYAYYKTAIYGPTAWWTASVGYWFGRGRAAAR